MSFVTHLECSHCGESFSHRQLQNLCVRCQKPLFARYDLEAVKQAVDIPQLRGRCGSMWRYRELLPLEDESEVVSMGEGWTPLLEMKRLARRHDVKKLHVKDESVNPTGSFKARGISVAVGMASKLGARRLAMPSAGNAGGALAAYASRADLESHLFIPKETPDANVLEAEILATSLELVDGDISDAGRLVSKKKGRQGWFDMSTLKEPYRIEGKKTLGYEIAEQLDWRLPDVVLYPTGGGTGLIGMWKAFDEMQKMGWIGAKRPRMVSVQSDGCAPIVKAFSDGREFSEKWPNPRTFAAGIRVPSPVGDFLILRAIRDSHGLAVAVPEEEIFPGLLEIARSEGLFFCPEGAACWAAFRQLRKDGWIEKKDQVVIFNTGAGQKYTDYIRTEAAKHRDG